MYIIGQQYWSIKFSRVVTQIVSVSVTVIVKVPLRFMNIYITDISIKEYPVYMELWAKCDSNSKRKISKYSIKAGQYNTYYILLEDREVIDYDQYIIKLIPLVGSILLYQIVDITLYGKYNEQ